MKILDINRIVIEENSKINYLQQKLKIIGIDFDDALKIHKEQFSHMSFEFWVECLESLCYKPPIDIELPPLLNNEKFKKLQKKIDWNNRLKTMQKNGKKKNIKSLFRNRG